MFFWILNYLLTFIVYSCELAGSEIGKCAQKSVFEDDSFCGNYVSDRFCIPRDSIVWPYSSVMYRDSIVKDIFVYYIQNRLLSEYIYHNNTQILSNNKQCDEAYRKFLCQFNFPRCQNEVTQQICFSTCVNFYETCLSSSDACDIIFLDKAPGLNKKC